MDEIDNLIPPPPKWVAPFVIARIHNDHPLLLHSISEDGIRVDWRPNIRNALAFDAMPLAKPTSRLVNGWVLPLALAEHLEGLVP